MVHVACIGDEYYQNVFIVGVYTTREKALEAAKNSLDESLNGHCKTPYTRYWSEEHRLDVEKT